MSKQVTVTTSESLDLVGEVIFNSFEEEEIPELILQILSCFDITPNSCHYDLFNELMEKLENY